MEVDASGDEVNNHRKSNGKKKTWTELKKEVRNVRRQLSSISSKIPSYFEFKEMVAENETRFCRIYFLSTLASGRETTLLYCDVPFDYAKSKIETFPWQPLLESSFQAQGHFSREEQMQMERKRCVIWGITSFDYQPSIGRFVFPASGSVFYCDDQQTQTPLHPHELEHFVSINSHLNPQMCPWNPDLIAYINNCDLWVHHIISCCDVRLTYARKGSTDLSEEPLSAGIPSYITQEEFNRYTGFWWQPVSIFSGGDIYHILYEEVDESQVELLYLPCFADEKEVEIYRFPRAGTKNAKSTLKIAQFRVTATNEIEVLPYLQLSDNITSLCPDIEYLVRAGWTPDGKHVWAKVLDRKQIYGKFLESDIWVNEKKRLVYFIGLKDSPLERHLYVVDIDNPHEPLRLTASGFSHSVAMNDDCTLFVTIQSSVGQPHFGQVYQICYSPNNPFTVQALGYFIEPSALPSSYRQPELFSHRLQSGHLIYGMLFKPPNMRVGEKYPTVLTIYGGPEVQLVTNSYKGMSICSLRKDMWLSPLIVVGRDIEELPLRVTSKVECDLDIFKVAVAGAPVTSWTLYDTGYTERYMGTPERNATGYSTGSVIDNANRFPDEENRLLIIHGLRDENVHFAHTSQLINALIKAGKPYQLQIYPTERHSLRHLDTSEHYETTLLSFLQQHL
ncbi:Dipeptidyl peptidase 9 like protein [Argiope bruennichi]|uniref:Dipeptidyl peptidase 9 like protein n=1 Tax=Argiope bruennichi TaxID=94029 RepID=A0A8T0EQL6_ARGBR|nr:Dipeptidyl peptidase 9 like protein [Argiope bruennichi]